MTTEREVAGRAGVEPDRRPRVRRYARRIYQFTAVLCLVTAVQAVIVAAVLATGSGRGLAIGAAVVLVAGGVALVVKSLPHDKVCFGGRAG